jgi:predicted ATPase
MMEDTHWIDPPTLELLERVSDAVAEAPVLVVLTSRPDNQPALAVTPHIARLALNRLGRGGGWRRSSPSSAALSCPR